MKISILYLILGLSLVILSNSAKIIQNVSPNTQNCENYDLDKKKCKRCNSGFTLEIDQDICIESGINGCLEYQKANGKCIKCQEAYSLSTNKKTCNLKCSAGSRWSITLNKCVSGSIKFCEAGGATYYNCQKCKNGYLLGKEKQKCEIPTINNCKVYSDKNPTCSTCREGYKVSSDGKKCEVPPIKNCQKYSNKDPICDACQEGQIFSSCSKTSCIQQQLTNCKQIKNKYYKEQ